MLYRNILIPVALDHHPDPSEAIAVAERLLAAGGRITLVAVVEDLPSYVAEYAKVQPVDHIKEGLRRRLKEIARGHPYLGAAILSGKPGVAIPDLAEQSEADLIIIHSHRPGVEDYFLGATASRVVRRAPCAVMVLRHGA